ncbi:MAG: GNAT family N-acetyltransferase [Pyrinomonadaceae bacterium]
MSADVIIRTAVDGDEEFILSLASRLADFELPPWRTPEEVEAGTRLWLKKALSSRSESACILLAERGGKLLGFIYVHEEKDFFTGAAYGHVSEVAVDARLQGAGIGSLLMNAAEQWAQARGYGRIGLNVFAGNERARRLYEHLGYTLETVKYTKLLPAMPSLYNKQSD